jgi:DNA-binding transcriptional MerR regulator
MARKKIDEAIRRKVLEAHASGLPMRKIAKEHGVSLSSVSRIVKEESLPTALQGAAADREKMERKKRIEELESKIAELERKILALETRKG